MKALKMFEGMAWLMFPTPSFTPRQDLPLGPRIDCQRLKRRWYQTWEPKASEVSQDEPSTSEVPSFQAGKLGNHGSHLLPWLKEYLANLKFGSIQMFQIIQIGSEFLHIPLKHQSSWCVVPRMHQEDFGSCSHVSLPIPRSN